MGQPAAPSGFPMAISHIWTAAITGEQFFLAITLGSLLSPNLGSEQKYLLMGCSIVHPQLFSMVVHCLWCCVNPPASPNNTSHNPGVSGASRLRRNRSRSVRPRLWQSVCAVINSCTDTHSHKSPGCLTAFSFN